jgi:uncharacterized membrane protein YgdD (TMEM256/DUF423 family)
MKTFIILGAINAFLSVAFGAFGAHILDGRVEPKYLDTWGKGVTYQMLHATGLLIVGVLLGRVPANAILSWSGWFMLIGIILFSGSLYVLVLTKISALGMITPFGGIAFLIAWALVITAAVKVL